MVTNRKEVLETVRKRVGSGGEFDLLTDPVQVFVHELRSGATTRNGCWFRGDDRSER